MAPCRSCGGRKARLGPLSAAAAAPQWDDAAAANNRSVMHPTGVLPERDYDASGAADADRVAEIAPPAEYPKLVDLGGGDGRVAKYLDRLGYEVLLVDAAPSMLNLARRRLPSRIRAVQSDGRDLVRIVQDVDVVLALGVLQYLTPAAGTKVLVGVAAALSPTGLVLLDVPLYDESVRGRDWWDPGCWTLDQLENAAGAAGLAVVDVAVGDGPYERDDPSDVHSFIHTLRRDPDAIPAPNPDGDPE